MCTVSEPGVAVGWLPGVCGWPTWPLSYAIWILFQVGSTLPHHGWLSWDLAYTPTYTAHPMPCMVQDGMPKLPCPPDGIHLCLRQPVSGVRPVKVDAIEGGQFLPGAAAEVSDVEHGCDIEHGCDMGLMRLGHSVHATSGDGACNIRGINGDSYGAAHGDSPKEYLSPVPLEDYPSPVPPCHPRDSPSEPLTGAGVPALPKLSMSACRC